PPLVLRRLLPAFVGRAGADQVDVGTEVLAVLAGPVAGTVGTKAKVIGLQLVQRGSGSGKQIADVKPRLCLQRFGFRTSPELFPFVQALRAVRRLKLPVDSPTQVGTGR